MASTNIQGIELPALQFVLTTAGNDHVLAHAPKGWEDFLVKQDRDNKYFATKRTYSLPMDFVEDGAFYLREQFYQYGIQATARLTINQLDPPTQTYQFLTNGDIDFSEFNDSHNICTVNLMDAGIESKIKAYGNVTYELDMSDGFDIELTPLELEEQAILLFDPTTDFRSDAYFSLRVVNNYQLSVNASVQNSGFYADSFPVWDASNNNFFYKATVDTSINIKGEINGALLSLNAPRNFQINVYKSDGGLVTTVYANNLPNSSIAPFHVDFDFDVSMLAGQRLFWYFERVGSTVSTEGFNVTDGILNLTYNTISPSSTCRALRPKQVFDKLLTKMNGSAYPSQSNHLATTWYQLAITSGDAIRGIEGAKLKTSWNDFWDSIDAETNASFGNINGKATLEAKADAYKKTLPIFDVGEVKNMELSPYTECFASSIKVGYEDETLDQTGGRTVFNSTQVYTTPITRVQKELSLISKYHAAALETELLRVTLSGKDSTDNSSDNRCFFIYVKSVPEIDGRFQPEGVDGYNSVTNVQGGEYNITLSPKQMLYRYGDYIASMLDKLNGGKLFFASATKDVSMVTVSLTGKRIAEADNVNIPNLGDPLFLPYKAEFTCKLKQSDVMALQAVPNGYISFTYRGGQYRGFIVSIGINPSRNKPQKFTLLLTPDNTLMGLVK